ncbi:hypothetical protein I6N96_08260 [Enterococcus sp. BWM-S5]|uniref:Uncharacterized protein n=1 Tax=Enterococcus larvae TaxID=2794352 RepID=A0ABS4CI18_9ENTE|nr:hypothetical protein [Enterococcus larvae]MBP1046276.1 hypothetical protein [Enterococcus larvae]
MAKYLSLRGWIECDEQDLEEIKQKLIESQENIEKYPLDFEQAEYYSKGWRFPENNIGWSSYIFYGADIKNYALDYIIFQFENITDVNEEIIGYLFISDDEGEESKVLKFNKQSYKTDVLDILE